MIEVVDFIDLVEDVMLYKILKDLFINIDKSFLLLPRLVEV